MYWYLLHNHDTSIINNNSNFGLISSGHIMSNTDHGKYPHELKYQRVYFTKVKPDIVDYIITFDCLKELFGLEQSEVIAVYDNNTKTKYLAWPRDDENDRFISVRDMTPELKEQLDVLVSLRRICQIGPYLDNLDNLHLVRNIDGKDKLIGLEYNCRIGKINLSSKHIITVGKIIGVRTADQIYQLVKSRVNPFRLNSIEVGLHTLTNMIVGTASYSNLLIN